MVITGHNTSRSIPWLHYTSANTAGMGNLSSKGKRQQTLFSAPLKSPHLFGIMARIVVRRWFPSCFKDGMEHVFACNLVLDR
jgi:hypothetical protein